MERVSVEGNAKINIGLDVMQKRPDGYHEVRMIMESVDLSDIITIERADGNISIETDDPTLPADGRNLAVMAAREFADYVKEKKAGVPPDEDFSVHISIKKRIPKEAGLAGGSTDAAATIKAMDKLFKTDLSEKEMMEIGERIGSDVPYCISGKTALATGRGEIITHLPDFPDCYIVISKPAIGVSTGRAYAQLDDDPNREHPDIDKLAQLICANARLSEIAEYMGNSFENVIIREHQIIKELKDDMEDLGAVKALMSGSGPTVYGLFEKESDACVCAKKLKEKYVNADTFIARKI